MKKQPWQKPKLKKITKEEYEQKFKDGNYVVVEPGKRLRYRKRIQPGK